MTRVIVTSEYRRNADGSGVITQSYDDGTSSIHHLPPLWVADFGPGSMSAADASVQQAYEDEITEADREEQR